jgi:hypothetical protein
LQAAQAAQHGVEEVEQEQGGVLVEEEFAIAGRVAGDADRPEPFKQRRQQAEVLEALQVAFGDSGTARLGHDWRTRGAAPERRQNGREPSVKDHRQPTHFAFHGGSRPPLAVRI